MAILNAPSPADVCSVLAEVDAATRRGLHAAGFLCYEAAPAFDDAFIVQPDNRLPLAWFGLFREYTVMDVADAVAPVAHVSHWTSDLSRSEYDRSIVLIREAIAEGRTYQVNLTARLRTEFRGQAEAWYEALRRAQGSGYHAFFDLDEFAILSASPELFFARRGNTITARPMKGTRLRGRYPAEDEARARELIDCQKERAENLMIVDLLRNDLGRIADTGSVQVPARFELERYPTVWQLTSTIQARLASNIGLSDIFGALFPCGSVTGAPKISTVALIAGLERSPREVYCGALGVVEPGGDCTFNVPIRTVWIDRDRGWAEYGVGGGITWDSLAAAEYDELHNKAAILNETWPPFQLIETMRLQDGALVRRERHLQRMHESARYFGFTWPETDIHDELAELERRTPAGPWRVRLLLAENGTLHIEHDPLDETREAPPRTFALADTTVSSQDRFRFHKTTHRASLERARTQQPDVFDVLLHNERAELTEFTRGNLVLELDGQRFTPPLTAGLLAGTFRQELLEQGLLAERILYRADLSRATRVWLINSLREWVELQPVGSVGAPHALDPEQSGRTPPDLAADQMARPTRPD